MRYHVLSDNSEYTYLFNVTAFDEDTMKWIGIGQCILSKDDSDAFSIGLPTH